MKPIQLVLVALLTGGVGLADAAASGPPPRTPAEATVLVRRLGAPSFAAREEASRQLLRLGRPALLAVRAGLTDPDLEIRRRCAELLARIDRPELPPRLAAFLAGTDRGLPPLPGWELFRTLAGTDPAARMLYLEIYQQDRAWLDQLQAGPAQAAGLLSSRVAKLQPRLFGAAIGAAVFVPQKEQANRVSAAELAVVFASSAVEPGNASAGFYQVVNLAYQQEVQGEIRGNPALRKVVEACLARRADDPMTVYQVSWVAKLLDLRDLLEGKLRPAVIRQLEAALATQPPDYQRLSQAAGMAVNLGMQDKIPLRVQAVVRELARRVANNPGNSRDFYIVMNVVQNLRMQEVIDQEIKPAVSRKIQSWSSGRVDLQQLYQMQNLCVMLNLMEARDELRPIASRLVLDLAQSGDQNNLTQALSLAQSFNLPEVLEGVVKPGVRKHILATLEQGQDLNRLIQLGYLATATRSELVESTLRPILRRQARDLAARPATLPQVQSLYQAALQLGAQDVTNDFVKPALQKALLAAASQPVNAGTVDQSLQLARQLQIKEGVGLALKAAESRTLPSYSRANAILFAAVQGTAEQVKQLEPLLSDRTNLGSLNINGGLLTTELRDVVLAALVYQSGQRLADYGFSSVANLGNGPFNPAPVFFGFPDAPARDKAQARWKKWRADHKKGE
jgi:hypothetical protein